jgi:hypothetical protein
MGSSKLFKGCSKPIIIRNIKMKPIGITANKLEKILKSVIGWH